MKKRRFRAIDKPREFYIMNRDAMFFRGLLCNDIVWTDNPKDAKTFNEPSKISMLKRWKPEEKMEIVFKD